jgi:carbonic anhydrase/acetyltransferase-like protein (isoleucine patch superfamily)
VPEGKEIGAGLLAIGVPARIQRPVRQEERERVAEGVEHYRAYALTYQHALAAAAARAAGARE